MKAEDRAKALAKLERLNGVIQELRQGTRNVSITRLTVLKSFCEDPKATVRFGLHLIEHVRPQADRRFRPLIDDAVIQMRRYRTTGRGRRYERTANPSSDPAGTARPGGSQLPGAGQRTRQSFKAAASQCQVIQDPAPFFSGPQFSRSPAGMQSGTIPCGNAGLREFLVIVMDVSTSMGSAYDQARSKLEAAIRASIALVIETSHIDAQDQIAVVSFDSRAVVELPFQCLATHRAAITRALQSLATRGGTDINEGLKTACGLFDFSQTAITPRIALLTDGQGGHPLRTAEEFKSRGGVIDVTGVGESPSEVDEALLKQVASVVNGELRYCFIKDQRTLVDRFTAIGAKNLIA